MIQLPEKCLRHIKDCEPYSQIASDCGTSYFCCGKNNGTISDVKQDTYTCCFKGEYDDDMKCFDKRDLTHQAAVIIQSLAIIEEIENEG